MEIALSLPVFVAITVGLVEIVKRMAPSVKRFLPLFALAFGVILSFYYGVTVENAIKGIVVGLTSVGLFSSAKGVKGGK